MATFLPVNLCINIDFYVSQAVVIDDLNIDFSKVI